MKGQIKRIFRLMLLFALLAALVAGTAGCRPSPKLEQVIYKDDSTEIDTDNEKKDPEDQGQEDDEFVNEEDPEEDVERDEQQTAATQDDQSTGNNTSRDATYSPSGTSQSTASGTPTEGTGSAAGTGTGTSTNGTGTSQNNSQQNQGTGENTNGGNGSGDSGDGGNGSTEGNGEINGGGDETPKKKVTDADGNEQEIPENVDKVTAVGYAAGMVEMLGGTGRLEGSSEDFVSNTLANSLFSDVSDGSVQSWWSGDGTSALDDNVLNTIINLEDEEQPDVCFYVSGEETLTNDQIVKLEAAGITCLPLPALKSEQDLINAAYIIAQCLDSGSDTSATAKANRYEDYINNLPHAASASYYGLYICDYLDIGYHFTTGMFSSLPQDQDGNGSGVAIAYGNNKNQIISSFMNDAGVTNESTEGEIANNYDYAYVTPMFNQFNPYFDDRSILYYSDTGSAYDRFVSHATSGDTWVCLGESEENSVQYFPAIIVANNYVANEISSNFYWQYYEDPHYEGEGAGSITYHGGYVAPDQSAAFYSSIQGYYQIYVNPYGLGDWAEGSVDSPLETYFAEYTTGQISEEEFRVDVQQFYNQMFDVVLDDNTLNTIINGR